MNQLKDKMRKVLNESLEVYYVKNEETNRKREADKQKAIEWIINGILSGPNLCGVLGSETSNPEFSWTFGGDIWTGEKRCILIRDPLCRICGVRPSVEVHHIRPKHLKGNPQHPQNLIGLCLECHDEVHRRIDRGIQKAIDESLKEVEVKTYQNKTLTDWGYEE